MSWKVSALAGLLMTVSPPAGAQYTSGGPAPGTVDSTTVARGNRDQQESYNRTVGTVKATEEAAAATIKGPAAATPTDIVAGETVRDSARVNIGVIEWVDGEGSTIRTGDRLAKPLLDSFGKDQNGLRIGHTAAQFSKALAKTAQLVPEDPSAVPATLADIKPGSALRDIDGVQNGTVDKLVEGAVLVAFEGRTAKLSVDSFGKGLDGPFAWNHRSRIQGSRRPLGPAKAGQPSAKVWTHLIQKLSTAPR